VPDCENNRDPRPDGDTPDNKQHTSRNSLALAFATIERPQVAQRLIASARRRFPTMPIYVADQSLDVSAMSSFYTQMNVTLIRMPYDAGVCASRNCLAASVAEEYFVLCDDDFVFGARTDFGEALRILHHHPEIGVVGGKLYDYDGSMEKARRWELFLHLDIVNRTLTSIPIFYYAPCAKVMGSTRFYMCDAVMNFSVMRRAIFTAPAIRWDERFKSNGEHEDFFLNMKLNSSVRVAYLPTMVAYHHHPEAYVAYRTRLRNRLEGWKRMFAKWNIDQHLEVGLEVRTIDDFNAVVATEEIKARFFLNDNLSLRRKATAPALLIGQDATLSAIGMLDKAGEANADFPGMARLLVHAGGGRIVTGPGIESSYGHANQLEIASHETPQSRYSFVPRGSILEPDRITSEIIFRYNPIARSDADLIVWYRVAPPDRAQKAAYRLASGTCAIHLRWYADDDRILMWESTPNLLDLCRTDYWVPLLVEVPVCPRGCAFMRFEVVAGESSVRRPLAIGFLINHPSAESTVARGVPPPAIDVLALTPWPLPIVQSLLPPVNLGDLEFPALPERLTPQLCAQAPALVLLPIGSLIELDAVFLFGWEGLGTPLSVIRLPDRGLPSANSFAPTQIALPRLALQSVRVVAFINGQGYREVSLLTDYLVHESTKIRSEMAHDGSKQGLRHDDDWTDLRIPRNAIERTGERDEPNFKNAGPQIFSAFWHGPPISPMHWACLASFIERGHQVDLYAYEHLQVPTGVNVRDANEVLPIDKLFVFHNPNLKSPDLGPFSDLFRFKLLLDRGGWWIDADVLCNRSDFPECGYAWANEFHELKGTKLNIGTSQIKFPKGDRIVKQLYDECSALIPVMTRREEIGPDLITSIIKRHATPLGHFGSAATFYPIQWIESFKLWLPEYHHEVAAKLRSAFFVACWASQLSYIGIDLNRRPPTGSYMEEILRSLAPNKSSLPPYASHEIIALVQMWLAKHRWAQEELRSRTTPSAMALLGF
jgi:Capsular polysaccharide synthesis protein